MAGADTEICNGGAEIFRRAGVDLLQKKNCGGQIRGSGGRKSPSGVQGRSPGRGSGGQSTPEAEAF